MLRRKGLQKIVLLPDFHYPHHNKHAVKAVFKFIKWFEPNTVVILGDGLEMEAVNHWQHEKGNRKFLENKDVFSKDMIDDRYNLIYDIPENPIGRLKELNIVIQHSQSQLNTRVSKK